MPERSSKAISNLLERTALTARTSAHPTVVIFRDQLLDTSETFIRAQAQALSHFNYVYAGSRRVPGLELRAGSTYTVSKGNIVGQVREALFKLFGTAPSLIRDLRALRPILMHAHFGSDGFRALPLSRQLGVPLIVTFHGSDATALHPRRNESYYGHRRYLAHKDVLRRRASLFIAVSDFIRRKLFEQHFSLDQIVVHYTGVDTELFCAKTEHSDPVVLFVGRLSERKGATFLIRAMAEVQKQHPNTELVLIGDGPLRRELETQARNSLRRYRFLGNQSPETVRDWMGRASVFSLPSVKISSGEEEAFGMVVAEAQARQTPVAAFASGGIVEAVQHGQTGFLAPERDWRTLAQYLALLISDQDLRRKFGRAGRQRVLRMFDLHEQTRKLENIYEEIVESNDARPGTAISIHSAGT